MKLPLRASVIASVAVLGVGLVAPASGSFAKNGSSEKNRTIKTGTCSNAANWKLKAKPDDGLLEVEFEVDSNRVGEVWAVRIKMNGERLFAGNARTEGRSGSFDVEIEVVDQVGKDRFRAVAKRGTSKCVGALNR
jgi:hypothetical protein